MRGLPGGAEPPIWSAAGLREDAGGRARWIIMSAQQDRERGLVGRCGAGFTCLMTGVENGLGLCSNGLL